MQSNYSEGVSSKIQVLFQYNYVSVACFLRICYNFLLLGSLYLYHFAHRYPFMELKKSEQDLIILGHLVSHRRSKVLENHYGQNTKRGKSRLRGAEHINRQDMQYYFADLPVCRQFYFFVYNIGKKRYENLIKHFDEHGLAPYVHISTGKTPNRSNVLSVTEIQKIVDFIRTFAERVAVPLPGRLPQFRDYKVMKLPSVETKRSVYKRYKDAATDDPTIRLVEESTFCKIWRKYCPYIATMRPANDLCDVCREHHSEIARSVNQPDEVKASKLNSAVQHLQQAQVQREFYNSWRDKSKSAVPSKLAVLSFDFAENVSYPRSPQQVSSAYFRTARKCGIFGIRNEATNIQTNFLIDEEDHVGKGANVVASILHYYMETHPADKFILFADNCVGQNKNNTIIDYLLWRVLMGKNENISLNFLLTGHTKFGPDRNFGILKAKYSRANVDCLNDFINIVNSSSPNGYNVAIPSIDPVTQVRNITWYKWDVYLQQFFKALKGIRQYHHFCFYSDGRTTAKLFADSSEEVIRLQTSTLNIAEAYMMEEIIPEGFSNERAWYLYEHIRSLCHNHASRDLVAPKPTVSKRKGRKRKTESN